MLTPKQEKYVQNLIKGMSQRQAYRDAYPDDKSSDETIDKNACKLFHDSKIISRYKELLDKTQEQTIMTAIERKKWLTEVIKDIQREECNVKTPDGEEIQVGLKNADLNTKMKAMDILNKMDGEYKTILEGDVSVKLEDVL